MKRGDFSAVTDQKEHLQKPAINLDIDESDVAFAQLSKVNATNCKFVYGLIQVAGKMGLTEHEIFNHFPGTEVELIDTLEQLSSVRHPILPVTIVTRVGFNCFRYVTHEHLSEWVVNTGILVS